MTAVELPSILRADILAPPTPNQVTKQKFIFFMFDYSCCFFFNFAQVYMSVGLLNWLNSIYNYYNYLQNQVCQQKLMCTIWLLYYSLRMSWFSEIKKTQDDLDFSLVLSEQLVPHSGTDAIDTHRTAQR